MVTWNGRGKALARNLVPSQKKPYKRILDLPGVDVYSVSNPQKNGLADLGLISQKTEYIGVERQKNIFDRIQKRIRKLVPHARLHYGLIEQLPLQGPFDLVNLDLMGSLSVDTLQWISRLNFYDGARFNCWLVTGFRGRNTIEQRLKASFISNEEGYKSLLRMANACSFSWPEKISEKVSLAALMSALSNYNLEVLEPYLYSDKVNGMCLYRFNIRSKLKKPLWPSFNELLINESPRRNPIHYGARQRKLLSMDMSVSEMSILLASKKNVTKPMFAFLTRRVRTEIRHGLKTGHRAIMIRAGWKAAITKMTHVPQTTRLRACEIIDNVKL